MILIVGASDGAGPPLFGKLWERVMQSGEFVVLLPFLPPR